MERLRNKSSMMLPFAIGGVALTVAAQLTAALGIFGDAFETFLLCSVAATLCAVNLVVICLTPRSFQADFSRLSSTNREETRNPTRKWIAGGKTARIALSGLLLLVPVLLWLFSGHTLLHVFSPVIVTVEPRYEPNYEIYTEEGSGENWWVQADFLDSNGLRAEMKAYLKLDSHSQRVTEEQNYRTITAHGEEETLTRTVERDAVVAEEKDFKLSPTGWYTRDLLQRTDQDDLLYAPAETLHFVLNTPTRYTYAEVVGIDVLLKEFRPHPVVKGVRLPSGAGGQTDEVYSFVLDPDLTGEFLPATRLKEGMFFRAWVDSSKPFGLTVLLHAFTPGFYRYDVRVKVRPRAGTSRYVTLVEDFETLFTAGPPYLEPDKILTSEGSLVDAKAAPVESPTLQEITPPAPVAEQ